MHRIGFDVAVPFLPYGEQWRRSRKWIQASFVDQAALVRWQPMQREVTTELLSRLAQTPEDFVVHIRQWVFLHLLALLSLTCAQLHLNVAIRFDVRENTG